MEIIFYDILYIYNNFNLTICFYSFILRMRIEMSKPVYSIWIDNKIQWKSETFDREEAYRKFEEYIHLSDAAGSMLDLKVSSRGIVYTLKSEVIKGHDTVADYEAAPAYKSSEQTDSKQEYEEFLCSLHNIGFSASEISEITGKTQRVVNYALSKLKAADQIKSHRRGRPVYNTSRDKKPVTIQLYKDNYDYLMEKFGNVSNAINDLVDEYKKEHEKE